MRLALFRSGTELKLEDRVMTWQQETARARRGSSRGRPMPTLAGPRRPTNSSFSLISLDKALRSRSAIERESESRPLTVANLSLWDFKNSGANTGGHHERRGSLAALKQVGKAVRRPITASGKGIVRMQQRCEALFTESKAKRLKAARGPAIPLLPLPSDSTPSSTKEDVGTASPSSKDTGQPEPQRSSDTPQQDMADDSSDLDTIDERRHGLISIDPPQLDCPSFGSDFLTGLGTRDKGALDRSVASDDRQGMAF
ncbi:hypothetical protein B0A50_04242 [Salinomyces thailandicus]|uniref:Uncharacterized protein n=1 Tax=Salinomyces thailandicus TaxID=706561 RepID=A0A4U0TXR3_9PEZI|nr:hypothetical protein B0A50_04242 [Salinomyces thailandica]